jgi:hypothetical protein
LVDHPRPGLPERGPGAWLRGGCACQRPGYPGLVCRAATLPAAVLIGAGLLACSGAPARGHPVPGPATSPLLQLRCSDSAGQQARGNEKVVRGVEGLVLPGSRDPAGLYPIRASDGKRYFVYKAFLAVSASAAPFATVSVTRPAGARLIYGSSSRIGELMSGPSGQALVAASRTRVRLPVCGPRFTGFVGGIIVTRPACVTFSVSSPSLAAAAVSVPIGPARCGASSP